MKKTKVSSILAGGGMKRGTRFSIRIGKRAKQDINGPKNGGSKRSVREDT